ncbi:hypothetical protein KP509_01G031500 [Ceratopteris richardii]|uniref:U1-type domain-containing protein n=1 Tax=Ceratopteris richardii TaxID=49495 RepID=A0A8T2VC01_CERRI|nr:hypothetical protein KP509_01G031500 [Ceratopteris richardii]
MVWFQCEDCGENLKKPKLPNHFRNCSSQKLSCIDCGVTFTQQSVQGHTQCISEAEKYGPKNMGVVNKEKKKASCREEDADNLNINLGLSTRPPWSCSICNVKATSQETLLLHSQGKKHKSKVRSVSSTVSGNAKATVSDTNKEEFSIPLKESDKEICTKSNFENGRKETLSHVDHRGVERADANQNHQESTNHSSENGVNKEHNVSMKKRRKLSDDNNVSPFHGKCGVKTDLKSDEICCHATGERINGSMESLEDGNIKHKEPFRKKHKKQKSAGDVDKAWSSFIKWKKLIKRCLKNAPDGSLKIRHLRRSMFPYVMEAVNQSGLDFSKESFSEELERQVRSHKIFSIDGKLVRLTI